MGATGGGELSADQDSTTGHCREEKEHKKRALFSHRTSTERRGTHYLVYWRVQFPIVGLPDKA